MIGVDDSGRSLLETSLLLPDPLALSPSTCSPHGTNLVQQARPPQQLRDVLSNARRPSSGFSAAHMDLSTHTGLKKRSQQIVISNKIPWKSIGQRSTQPQQGLLSRLLDGQKRRNPILTIQVRNGLDCTCHPELPGARYRANPRKVRNSIHTHMLD